MWDLRTMLCPWDLYAMLMHTGCAHYFCAPASHAPRLASACIAMIVQPLVAAVAAASSAIQRWQRQTSPNRRREEAAAASLAAAHQTSPNRNPVVEAAAFLAAAAAAQQTSRSRLVGVSLGAEWWTWQRQCRVSPRSRRAVACSGAPRRQLGNLCVY